MYTDLPAPVDGQCLDSDYIKLLLANQAYLYDCSQTNNQQFTCKQIEAELSGQIKISSSTETCFDLQILSGLVNPNTNTENEQKMLAFTFGASTSVSISDSSNATVATTRSARIVCNGDTVKTLSAQDLTDALVITFFECSPNSDVQLCFDSQLYATNGQPGLVQGTQSINICASLICITTTENSAITGYFNPPLPDDCCLGREAVHLLIQNATALRNTFGSFGQIPSCETFTFDDDDDHVLENTTNTVMDFLVLGELTVCGQNNSTFSSATITAKPVVSCGSTSINCISAEAEIPPAEDGPTSNCVVVPVLACGQCQPGESLTTSVRSQFQCNEKAGQVIDGISAGITDISQEYCVYKFKRLDSDFGDALNGSLGKCLDLNTFTAIQNNLDAIRDICDDQTAINLTNDEITGIAGIGDTITIKSAQPWPPAAPLPRPIPDPPPDKKWYITGYVYPCTDNFAGINAEDLRVVEASASILCGGDELLSGTRRWTLTNSGFESRCGFPI